MATLHDMSEVGKAVEFRLVTHDDYGFLYGLHREVMRGYVEQTWGWDEAWQQDYFARHFRPETEQIIVLHGEDIGLVSVRRNQDELFIENIEILPEFQNQGVGTFIISRVIEEAHRQNCSVALQVLKVNPAQRLYGRLGFTIEGATKTHYLMQRP